MRFSAGTTHTRRRHHGPSAKSYRTTSGTAMLTPLGRWASGRSSFLTERAALLGRHTDLRTEDGRARIVRHGHLPGREILTGLGPLAVRQPQVRDRGAASSD